MKKSWRDFLLVERGADAGLSVRQLAWVFAAVFVFVLLEGVVVRLILLPYILPTLHAGQGFMVGGDSIGFHTYAMELAERIRHEGWQVWSLRPSSEESTLATPAGIAAAVYALFGSNPMYLLPLNATLHAGSAVLLVAVAFAIFRRRVPAYVAVLPFVLFPTALFWTSQLLKEGVFIFGIYAYLAGWVLLARDESPSWLRIALYAILTLLGLGFIWAVRTYLLIVFLPMSAMLGVGLSVWILVNEGWKRRAWARALGVMVFATVVFVAVSQIRSHDPAPKISEWSGVEAAHPVTVGRDMPEQFLLANGTVVTKDQLVVEADGSLAYLCDKDVQPSVDPSVDAVDVKTETVVAADQKLCKADFGLTPPRPVLPRVCPPWDDWSYLPQALNRLALKLAIVRDGYYDNVYASAGSTIDRDVCISSPQRLIEYFPRALQIGLTGPFPTQWINAKSHGGGASRLIAGVEMLITYVALIGIALLGWRYAGRVEFWMVVLFAMMLILLYSVVTPNMGALHRMRYGFLTPLVGIGLAMGFDWLRRRKDPS